MKVTTVIGAVVAAATTAVLVSSSARADTQSFLDAVHQLGYTENDQELMRDGYAACALRGETGDNDTVGKAIGLALRFLGHDTTDAQAGDFVDAAVTHLCPEVAQ